MAHPEALLALLPAPIFHGGGVRTPRRLAGSSPFELPLPPSRLPGSPGFALFSPHGLSRPSPGLGREVEHQLRLLFDHERGSSPLHPPEGGLNNGRLRGVRVHSSGGGAGRRPPATFEPMAVLSAQPLTVLVSIFLLLSEQTQAFPTMGTKPEPG